MAKVYMRGSDENPWTADRLIALFNTLARRIVGADALYYSEEEAVVANDLHDPDHRDAHRTIVVTITTSEDKQ